MRRLQRVFVAALLCGFSIGPALPAQESDDPRAVQARLRHDQESILRKAERLRDLMVNLEARYQTAGREREVELLQKGLRYLADSKLLESAASVRDSLDARALAQANEKANKVIVDLEALLNILLDRPSMEKIEEEIEKTRDMERSVAELVSRQDELLSRNRETRNRDIHPVERAVQERLRDLARMQEEEARQNQREAGSRQPFLESALQRIQELLQAQAGLEKAIAARRENPDAADPNQARIFELGALKQETAEQLAARAQQRELERIAERARKLGEAIERKDSTETQDARDALRGDLQDAAGEGQSPAEQALAELLEQLSEPDADLGELAKKAEKQATETARSMRERSDRALAELKERTARVDARLAEERKAEAGAPPPGQPEQDLADALKELEKAAATADPAGNPDTQRMMSDLSKALGKLSAAQAGMRNRNPAPDKQAGKMASEAAEAARELRNSPALERPGDTEATPASAEAEAARELDRAEQALREAARRLEAAAPDTATDRDIGTSRESLERARDTIEKQLEQEGQPEAQRAQAAARQAELKQAAEAIRDQMRQAQQDGALSPEQQKAADQAVERAQQQMGRAQQSLEANRQSAAAEQQQRASDELEKATAEMDRNRPLNAEQREQLAEQAKKQKELADEIMRLARLAEERKNERAKQSLEDAGKAAEQAAKELDEADPDQAEQRQEEAKKKLEEAQKELEEERERYEDLRREELLFKMKEELTQLLARQEPITQQTSAAAKEQADGGRLSRRDRRRLNELGEEEKELANKCRYLREALLEENVLVFSHALEANELDLTEVERRLSGRSPAADEVTLVLQRDVEERTRELLLALQREQKRREEKQQQQDQQQQDPQQQDNQEARERLVSITAELEMLKRMEEDMMKRTRFMEKLIETRGDAVSDVDISLLERLAHRHSKITGIFLELKKQVEAALNPQPPADGTDPGDPESRGR